MLEEDRKLFEELFHEFRWDENIHTKRRLWRLMRKFFLSPYFVRKYFYVEEVRIGTRYYCFGFSKEVREAYLKMLKQEFDRLYASLPFKKGRPKKVFEANLGKVFDLRKQGYSIRKIAKELDLSKSKVERVLKWKRF